MNTHTGFLDITTFSEEQKQLWQMELDYWELFHSGNPACLKMISDAFLGWPHNADHPQEKSGLTKIVMNYASNPLKPTLKPVGMTIVGDAAIVHLIRTLPDTESMAGAPAASIRVIHSWVRQNGQWLLLGGMGYPED